MLPFIVLIVVLLCVGAAVEMGVLTEATVAACSTGRQARDPSLTWGKWQVNHTGRPN